MKGWGRYLRLCAMLCKFALMRQMAYRTHFFLMITGKVVRMALLLFFFQAVFLKVDRLGAWSYDHILLLFATFHLVDYLMSITFQRNLAFRLPERIHTGELDARMILPVNLLFISSLERFSRSLLDFSSVMSKTCDIRLLIRPFLSFNGIAIILISMISPFLLYPFVSLTIIFSSTIRIFTLIWDPSAGSFISTFTSPLKRPE